MSYDGPRDIEYRVLLDEWSKSSHDHRDRLGSVASIDGPARLRGARAIKRGDAKSLGRPLSQETAPALEGLGYDLKVSIDGDAHHHGASETLTVSCHGLANTHIDALNHFGVDGRWYSGWRIDDPTAPDTVDLATAGLVTRGVVVDVPRHRGEPYVAPDNPVTAAEIDDIIAASGLTFEPGDALVLYMGRDVWEREGRGYFSGPDPWSESRPGVGRDGARWLVEHSPSMLLWDFMDANIPDVEPRHAVHHLIWATGLVLVDNCDLGPLAAVLARLQVAEILVSVAPVAVPRGTGAVVSPLAAW